MLNIKQEPSPYFSSRGNWKISGVVIHTTVGNYEGTINWFKNNSPQVSAHYVVREDGSEITQMVAEEKAAHHAGRVSNPTTPVYRGDNPNRYTIGIENADGGNPQTHIRDAQIKTLAELVRNICLRNNIPIDRDHICGHREIYDKKTCPGNIDVDKVVELAKINNDDMPKWLKDLIIENNQDPDNFESWFRGILDTAKKYNDEVNDLREQLKSANERLSDTSSQLSIYVDKVQALDARVQELQETLNKTRSERDSLTWKINKLTLDLETKENENKNLVEKIERLEKNNNIKAYSWFERFISLFKRGK